MAVIVKIDDNGNPLFESVKGLDVTEEDRKKAVELNKLIEKKISKLTTRLETSKIMVGKHTRNKVEVYWEFGSILRKIFFESGLVDPAEKKLFWLNVRMHASEGLLAKDRGPNRLHVAYCFRLAGYPKTLALKREWSEWVYLFDSPFINNEERFDKWDKSKIEEDTTYTTRENTRLFIQCLNSILKDVETKDLNDEELIRCYEGSWVLSKTLLENTKFSESDKFKLLLKAKIAEKHGYAAQLIDGLITPEEFTKTVVKEISL